MVHTTGIGVPRQLIKRPLMHPRFDIRDHRTPHPVKFGGAGEGGENWVVSTSKMEAEVTLRAQLYRSYVEVIFRVSFVCCMGTLVGRGTRGK